MKGPTRKEESPSKLHDGKMGKQKRVLTSSLNSKPISLLTTYDEAKATCKARKRKERQESISSLCQERKVIRSSSEERPAQKKYVENKNSIRRVSSSEDFQSQRASSVERVASSTGKKGSDKLLTYDDCEHEKRRSHERFARPLATKGKKHPTKRLKVKCIPRPKYKPELSFDTRDQHKKLQLTHGGFLTEHDSSRTGFLKLHIEEGNRSPSPTQELVSPVVDWSTLHEQVDCSEPLTSRQGHETDSMPIIASNRLLSSPRNSIIATHRIYLDPDVPKVTTNLDKKPHNPLDERLHKLAKQINSIKKKIKKCEVEFENKHGYKPSHVEKMNDINIKKLYTELSSLKRDQKQLNEISTSNSMLSSDEKTSASITNLEITISEIEKKLSAKREAANRSTNIDEMSSEELVEEKVAVQKALLLLESIHGRPNTKEDRDVVRPFYDRYRTLKRMVSKLAMTNLSGNELATIHENEAMNFVTPTSSSQSNDTESEKTILPSTSTDSDTDSSVGDNLHSMTKDELIEQLKIAMEERKELKRKLKQFELEVQLKTGKMIQKEEKAPMESSYIAYKKIKAKSRLLEALVGKLS